MWFSWFNNTVPRSLFGRALLIVLLPVVCLQLVLSVVFVQRMFENVTEQMTRNVVLELRPLIAMVNRAPDVEAARAAAGPLAEALQIGLALPDPDPVTRDARVFYDLSGRLVVPTLRRQIAGIEGADLAGTDDMVDLTVATSHGPLGLAFDRDRVSAQNPHQLLVLTAFTSLLVAGVAAWFLRSQLGPIEHLADAAAAFGRGRSVPYRPAGATEIRRAGAAFLDMRHRLERQIDQRTTMLSGVSHDLRTPLTRMRLSLSMIDDEEATAMGRDVDEMQRMLDAFLAWAREGALDDPIETDPADLLCDAVENARRAGQDVSVHRIEGAGPVLLRPLAVTRVLGNLIGNAARHARRCELSLGVTARAVVFSVEDDGPGIREADRDAAVRPFVRLDTARDPNRGGGVGLGLSIAMDIARQHGGTLRLETSERLGGLRVDLILAR